MRPRHALYQTELRGDDWLPHQESNLDHEVQSLGHYHYAMRQYWLAHQESNLEPADSESAALSQLSYAPMKGASDEHQIFRNIFPALARPPGVEPGLCDLESQARPAGRSYDGGPAVNRTPLFCMPCRCSTDELQAHNTDNSLPSVRAGTSCEARWWRRAGSNR